VRTPARVALPLGLHETERIEEGQGDRQWVWAEGQSPLLITTKQNWYFFQSAAVTTTKKESENHLDRDLFGGILEKDDLFAAALELGGGLHVAEEKLDDRPVFLTQLSGALWVKIYAVEAGQEFVDTLVIAVKLALCEKEEEKTPKFWAKPCVCSVVTRTHLSSWPRAQQLFS